MVVLTVREKHESPANSSSSRIRQIVARTSRIGPAARVTVRLRARTNLDRAVFPATTLAASKKVAMLQATTSMAPRQVITVAVLKGTRGPQNMALLARSNPRKFQKQLKPQKR